MKYKYLEHTADAKFKAFGRDIDEVFTNSALAMFNILGDTTKVKSIKKEEIKVRTHDIESLLFDFLDGLLFLLETKRFFLHEVKRIKVNLKKCELTAIVVGDDLGNYELKSQIKAVTYNDMLIKKVKNGYQATVVVDI